jgi:hypothetical protein
MSSKITLRIDLGELDSHFERFAIAKGRTVSDALGEVVQGFVSRSKDQRLPGQKRVFRTVKFASIEERRQAQEQAERLNVRLGTALRLGALEQLLVQVGSVDGQGGAAIDALAGGRVCLVGKTESPTARLELRLTAAEIKVLEAKAAEGRYRSVQAMVVAITRAFLTSSPVLDPALAADLGRDNLALVRISHYINKLIQDVAGGKRIGPLDAAEVVVMLERVDRHTQAIAKMLAQAQGRWKLADKGGEHGIDG